MPASRSSRSASRSGATGKPRQRSAAKRSSSRSRGGNAPGDSLSWLAEQLVDRLIRPLDLVVLTREHLQETLDDAADRGRMTRSAADALVAELVRLGREQTDEMLSQFEQPGPGRSLGVGAPSPIPGYDELSASQVSARLESLGPPELRKLRGYEARHANRKSVLAAIERALAA